MYKTIASRNLLYSTGSLAQCSVVTEMAEMGGRGRARREAMYVYMCVFNLSVMQPHGLQTDNYFTLLYNTVKQPVPQFLKTVPIVSVLRNPAFWAFPGGSVVKTLVCPLKEA